MISINDANFLFHGKLNSCIRYFLNIIYDILAQI